jgi:putative transposase
VTGQARSSQRYRAKEPGEDEQRLVAEMRALATKHPRYGYRRVWRLLVREGFEIGLGRALRLWQREGLRVPQKRRKRRRLGVSANGSQRRRATARNEVWAYDFVMDRTEDGRRLKILTVVDEFTRECLAIHPARHLTAADVIEILAGLVKLRGAPSYLRSDNGPEFIARTLRRWLERIGSSTLFIEPGSPWQNAYIESFNGKLRDEFVGLEIFTSLDEARFLADRFREVYNDHRPHSALGGQTPSEFASGLGPCDSATLRRRAQGPRRPRTTTTQGLS